MSGLIKWMGSLTYTVGGYSLRRNEDALVDDKTLARLPSGQFKLLKVIPDVTESVNSDDGKGEVNSEDDKVIADDGKGEVNADDSKVTGPESEGDKKEVSDYYTEHTAKQMIDEALAKGIEVPSVCESKKDIYEYLVDNGFFGEGAQA